MSGRERTMTYSAHREISSETSSDERNLDRHILGLIPSIKRVIYSRESDPDTAKDMVQETLARMVASRRHLAVQALGPYSIVTARNVVASLRRTESRHGRKAHLLVDLNRPERPDEELLLQEEREAVNVALDKLSTQERTAVIGHEVEDIGTVMLAREAGTTPGGISSRLARARAKLRVDYLVALSKRQPPSLQCRRVLISLSAGDQRRQLAEGAGDHVLHCDFCASFSKPLLHRRRASAAV
jgi:RNA polymerase sigma factor (sigma-70 family)